MRSYSQVKLHRSIKPLARAALLAALVLPALSCDPPKAELPTAFALSVSPTTPVDIAPGGTAVITVTAARVAGYAGPISVELLGGARNDISATSVTIPAGSTTAQMTLHAVTGAPLGIQQIEVNGQPDDPQTWDNTEFVFPVNVTVPGTFTMTISGFPHNVYPGGIFHAAVTLSRNQFTQPVTLSVAPSAGYTFAITQPGVGNTADIAVTVGNAVPFHNTISFFVTASGPPAPDQSGVIETSTAPPTYALSSAPTSLTIAQGGNASVSLSAARDPGNVEAISITGDGTVSGLTATPTSITNLPVTFQVLVAATVPVGSYKVIVHGSQPNPDALFQQLEIPVIVTAGTFGMAAQTNPLSVAVGGTQPENVNFTRNGFSGGISVTSTSDDPHLTVTPSPAPAVNGNQLQLTVTAGSAARAGTHTISLSGVSGLVTQTGNFTVNVTLPAGGAPVALVIVPTATPTAPTAIKGATVTYTAFLIDAQGNRTLPAAGWNIGFATGTSPVATVQLPLPDYDITQRWRTAVIGAGQTTGTSTVTAFYFEVATGTSTFTAGSTLTVTP